MKRILVDTDIIIDHAKKKSTLLLNLLRTQKTGKICLCTNTIIVAEYFTGKQMADEVLAKRTRDELFSHFTFLPLSFEIGIRTAELIRNGVMDKLGDALIAATCLEHQCLLATRNVKHFQKVKKLSFYDL